MLSRTRRIGLDKAHCFCGQGRALEKLEERRLGLRRLLHLIYCPMVDKKFSMASTSSGEGTH